MGGGVPDLLGVIVPIPECQGEAAYQPEGRPSKTLTVLREMSLPGTELGLPSVPMHSKAISLLPTPHFIVS